MAVINQTQRTQKLFTEARVGDKLRLIVAEDDREEAQLVVTDIRDGIRMGRNPSEFAIMYRTNAQSRILKRLSAARASAIGWRARSALRAQGSA